MKEDNLRRKENSSKLCERLSREKERKKRKMHHQRGKNPQRIYNLIKNER